MTPPERITLRSISSDFLRDITQAEKGLWGTIVQLTVRPRLVLDTFLHKNRRHFTRPTRYLIFCLSIAAFQFIAVQWRYGVSLVEYNETIEDGNAVYSGAIEAFAHGFASARNDVDKIAVKKVAAYSRYVSVIFIPVFAFLYFFLFPSRDLNYAETLAGVTYLHSHFILLTAFGLLFFLAFSDIADFARAKNWIDDGVTVLLFVSILRTFLVAKRDALWIVPKLLLSVIWALPFFLLLGCIMSMLMSLLIPDMKSIPYSIILLSALVLLIVTVQAGRLLLVFRTRWPRWQVWVPTVFVTLFIYAAFAFSLAVW